MKCNMSLKVFLMFILLNMVLNLNLQKPSERKTSLESNSRDIIVKSEVSTLLEIPVSSTTSMSYYYPYFYKTHLISFADEVDTTVLIQDCFVPGCSWCSLSNPYSCSKCSTGFFLADDACVTYCPEGYYSDILRSKCVLVSLITTEIIFTKAYSTGSCSNTCGKFMQDCSCAPSCKFQGSCCTDYNSQNCENLEKNSQKVDCNLNENCKFCDDSSKFENSTVPKCNQCKDDFFRYEGKCLKSCPEGTVADQQNFICVNVPKIQNCNVVDMTGACKECKRGFFLHNNQCLNKCPSGYRADRITWACLEPPVFAWYWVYPSRSSCKNYCGIIVEEFDCSCSSDCFLWGNCCQDVDYFCHELLFWRKNSNEVRKTNEKKKLPMGLKHIPNTK